MASSHGLEVVVPKDFPVVVNVWHGVAGLYVWEFITTLDYEWDVIRGHRPYRWTIWVYSLMRVATLAVVLIPIIDMDLRITRGCEVLIASNCVLTFVAFATADILVVLRIIAVWNRQKFVMAIAIGIWVTNFVFFIQTVVRLRSTLRPAKNACLSLHIGGSKIGFIATLVTDLALLLILFVGLVRVRLRGGTLSLGRLLWKQGIIWLLLATVVEVPPVVYASLKLNGPLAIIFLVPGVVALSICATRMHHSLVDLVYGPTLAETAPDSLRGYSFMVSKVTQTSAARNSSNRTEGVVQRAYLQFSTPETSYNGSLTGAEVQMHHGPTELISNKDLEGRTEN